MSRIRDRKHVTHYEFTTVSPLFGREQTHRHGVKGDAVWHRLHAAGRHFGVSCIRRINVKKETDK